MPGFANGLMINPESQRAYGFMDKTNKAFLTSVALSIISGVALLCTAAKTTANRVFKAGFAGFGTLAVLIALFAVVKLYQNIQAERQRLTQQSQTTEATTRISV
jgi:membrane protein involved in colicin uptake